jgi:hypothetical protein
MYFNLNIYKYNPSINILLNSSFTTIKDIKGEFIYRSKNTYNKGIQYLIDRIYAYYLCRKS